MFNYNFTAVDQQGKQHKGSRQAESKGKLRELLAVEGLLALKVDLVGDKKFSPSHPIFTPKVKADDLMLFTRQFGILLKTGVPILQALSVLELQVKSPTLSNVISEIRDSIRKGMKISESMQQHPAIFNDLYCALIKAGEQSGALDKVLPRLSHMIAHDQAVKKDVASALRYPMMVVAFLGLAFIVVLTFVMPRMTSMFTKANVKLPLPTRVCITLGDWLQVAWPWLLGGSIVLYLVLKFGRWVEKGRYHFDLLLLNIPYVNDLILKSVMCRFSSIFAILISSGIPVLQGLVIMQNVVGNRVISRELEQVHDKVEEGSSIAMAISKSPYFTGVISSMIGIGEQSSALDELLPEVADFYDDELKYSINKLTDILPVILTLVMAGVVGFFVAAVFLPLFGMSKIAGGM